MTLTNEEKVELMHRACREKQKAAEVNGRKKSLYWKAQLDATMAQIREWL